jgi:glucose/arabinose dehydrogenase
VVREAREVELPEGFSVIKFADLQLPTSLAFDAQGRLFAASQLGTITMFSDTTGDGRADQRTLFADGFTIPTGLGHDPASGDLYVSSNTRITRLRDTDGDGSADLRDEFVTGLPVGLHQNNNIAFGRDGKLYIGIGSTCDVCVEKDARSATVMRFDLATGEGEIFATGLRNPFDLAFHPDHDALFATDNGRDDLGWGVPQEELNLVREGGDYGWPDCWDDLQGSGCAGTQPAIAFFEARSSVNSVSFYTGDRFPQEWRGNLFVAVFGSWVNPNVPRGIWRVVLTEDGAGGFSAETEWFGRWPLTSRLLGMAEGPDGALYVGDYQQGGIWRISYGVP